MTADRSRGEVDQLQSVQIWTGREAKALRLGLRLSVRAFAEHLGVAVRTISKWEAGGPAVQPRPDTQAILDTALRRADEEAQTRFSLLLYSDPASSGRLAAHGHLPAREVLDELELLRRGITDAMTDQAVTPSILDDWDQTVTRYGMATRDRPAGLLLGDLGSDLNEAHRTLTRCRSASSVRRLTNVIAQMSGLMCLTLVKLDERTAFRRWARTARIAAQEAGDATTTSWVLAQEAYGHYYSGDILEAIEVAQGAMALPGERACVGAALAAPLAARAHALLGRAPETEDALGVAESVLSKLADEKLTASALGYSESQLRFHEGNALTHLGKTSRAWRAQERALQLCPPDDFMDRALTNLDRASCLVRDGDVSSGLTHARRTVEELSAEERKGIISLRAAQIIRHVPERCRSQPDVRELQELLVASGRE
ncbi:MAG: helix-turn-helix domain-containing protein [Micromonosporaceae bacterium]